MSLEVAFKIARLPLRQRRLLFWLVWQVLRSQHKPFEQYITELLSDVLDMPVRQARQLGCWHAFYDALNRLERATFKFRSVEQLATDFNLSSIVNEAPLARLAADPQRSVILAPIHMGAYILAMAGLIHRHFRGHRVLIIRNREDDEEATVILQRIREIGCDVRFMNIKNKASFVDCLRFARKNCIVVCFVDLPETCGVAADVELFRRPARLAIGIDQLARAIDAPITTMSVASHIQGDVVTLGQPFDVGPPSPAERARVTRLIRDHIHNTIVATPAQWHMWPRVHEYMKSDDEPLGEALQYA